MRSKREHPEQTGNGEGEKSTEYTEVHGHILEERTAWRQGKLTYYECAECHKAKATKSGFNWVECDSSDPNTAYITTADNPQMPLGSDYYIKVVPYPGGAGMELHKFDWRKSAAQNARDRLEQYQGEYQTVPRRLTPWASNTEVADNGN